MEQLPLGWNARSATAAFNSTKTHPLYGISTTAGGTSCSQLHCWHLACEESPKQSCPEINGTVQKRFEMTVGIQGPPQEHGTGAYTTRMLYRI